uniref:Uncharacterized protein n=1 Tax=viral metagenome TaxID=1070528 RepID=A0A6C0M3J8_9ZZZZ
MQRLGQIGGINCQPMHGLKHDDDDDDDDDAIIACIFSR